MTPRKRTTRRAATGIATVVLTVGLGIVAVVGRGESSASAGVAPSPPTPLPRVTLPARSPTYTAWTRRTARLTAIRVDLEATGTHTHGNWIFFRLPFESTDSRINDVRVEASAMVDPDVAAMRIGTACLPSTTYGPLGTWSGYTIGGIGATLPFSSHPSPPTDDATIYGINVPSRVANYVACGLEKSIVLRDRATWHLDVSWEER